MLKKGKTYLGESTNIFTDIETVPLEHFDSDTMYREINPELYDLAVDLYKAGQALEKKRLIEYLQAKHTKTSDEKIEAEKYPELIKKHLSVLDKINKQKANISCDPMTARILCIGFAVNNSKELSDIEKGFPNSKKGKQEFYDHIKKHYPPDYFYAEKPDDEEECLGRFWSKVLEKNPFRLIGFNIWTFDLWFMLFRSLKYRFPFDLPFNFNTYPSKYDKNHCCDLMLTLSLYGSKNWKSLDAVIAFLGIDKKIDMDGSMIYDMFLAGNHKKITEYSAQDINDAREIYLRTEAQ